MQRILKIPAPFTLIAAAIIAADNRAEFFAKSPGLVLAGGVINTPLINLVVFVILWKEVRHSPGRR